MRVRGTRVNGGQPGSSPSSPLEKKRALPAVGGGGRARRSRGSTVPVALSTPITSGGTSWRVWGTRVSRILGVTLAMEAGLLGIGVGAAQAATLSPPTQGTGSTFQEGEILGPPRVGQGIVPERQVLAGFAGVQAGSVTSNPWVDLGLPIGVPLAFFAFVLAGLNAARRPLKREAEQMLRELMERHAASTELLRQHLQLQLPNGTQLDLSDEQAVLDFFHINGPTWERVQQILEDNREASADLALAKAAWELAKAHADGMGVFETLFSPRPHFQLLRMLAQRIEGTPQTIDEIMNSSDERSGKAAVGTSEIAAAAEAAWDSTQRLKKSCATARGMIQHLVTSGNRDLLSQGQAIGALLEEAEAAVTRAQDLAIGEPLRAPDAVVLRAEQLTRVVLDLTTALSLFWEIRLAASSALASADISAPWIDVRLSDLSRVAAAALAAREGQDLLEQFSTYRDDLAQLGADVARTAELAAQIQEDRNRLEAAAADSLDSTIVYPSGHHPFQRIKRAQGLVATARERLGEGRIAEAHQALERAAELYDEAALLLTTPDSLRGRLEELIALRDTLLQQLPEVNEAWRRIGRYPPSARYPDPSDGTHPATYVLQLVNQEITDVQSMELTQTADVSRLLTSASGHLDQLLHHWKKILEHDRHLRLVVALNGESLPDLRERLLPIGRQIAQDVTVRHLTVKAFEGAPALLRARRLIEAEQKRQQGTSVAEAEQEPQDPFEVQAILETAERQLQFVEELVDRDRTLHAVAQESVRSAQRAFNWAAGELMRSQTSGIAVSQAVPVALQDLRALNERLETLKSAAREPHGDWVEVAWSASRIVSDAARAIASLQGEDQTGESQRMDAIRQIEAAADAVRNAGNWFGSGGMIIPDSRGSDQLRAAEAAFLNGDHDAPPGSERSSAKGLAFTAWIEATYQLIRAKEATADALPTSEALI